MEMQPLKSGILLAAEPFMKDESFIRSVVLICEYGEEGAVGFILNKSYIQTLDYFFEEFEGYKIPVFFGGPVKENTLHFVHTRPDLVNGGFNILDDIFWGGDFEELSIAIKEKLIKPNEYKIFIGYSGWASGQLEQELKGNDWLTVEADREIVFETKELSIWQKAIKKLGSEYSELVNYPIDPSLN